MGLMNRINVWYNRTTKWQKTWQGVGAGTGALAGLTVSAQYLQNPVIISLATLAGGVVGAVSPAAGVAGGVLGTATYTITPESQGYAAGFAKGKAAGHQEGNATGYPAGFHAGKQAGQDIVLGEVPGWVAENRTAWEQQQLDDLEGRILSDGRWTSEKANATADELFGAHNLSALKKGDLLQLYGTLSFDAGVYSTPAAQNATIIIKQAIMVDFSVSASDLSRITDPFAALVAYRSLSSLEGEKRVKQQAGIWNATWYNTGKAAILALANEWNTTNYFKGKTDGAKDIFELADGWNNTWLNTGKEQSLGEVINVVDDLISRAQIDSAGGSITTLLGLYKQKVESDAYAAGLQDMRAKVWMAQVTPQYVAQLNFSQKNDTLREWARLADLHRGVEGWEGWQYAELKPGFDLSGILNDQNITNGTKSYLRSALNGGDRVMLFNLTNNGSDAANGSVAARYNTQTGRISTTERVISDAEISRIFAYVKGGS